jgi:hypothetical protein
MAIAQKATSTNRYTNTKFQQRTGSYQKSFGGNVSLVQYGPNPISFIAGNLYLMPGEYTVILSVKVLRKDYSYFDTKFLVDMDRKIKCS